MACNSVLAQGEEFICTHCRYHLPKTNFHSNRGNAFEQRLWGRVPVQRAFACYYFNRGEKVQHLIHALKYDGMSDLGVFLGRLYGHELSESGMFDDVDFIVPIPLHRSKKRKRGFNQSEVFARGLAESCQVPMKDFMVRNKYSETQTRKSRDERWKNVRRIFGLKRKTDSRLLENKHILLVDDVVTTGATFEATAMAFEGIPGIRMSFVAIAFAV